MLLAEKSELKCVLVLKLVVMLLYLEHLLLENHTIDPTSSYDYKDSTKIPSFRDIVSLEQQQAYADKVDARRAERKEGKKKDESVGVDKINKEDFVALDDQSLDAGVDFTKPAEKFDPLAEDKIKYGNTNNVMDLKVNS